MGLPPSLVLAAHWTENVLDDVAEANNRFGEEGGTGEKEISKIVSDN